MRLLTMNLWGTRGAWDERRRVLRDGFEDLRPDVCTLQETIVADGYDQVRDLLGAEFHVVHQTDREDDGQGISIASRWPLSNVREVDLDVSERTADFACTTLLAEVEAPFGPLLVVNHFPSWKLQLEAEREAQAVIAARAIEGIDYILVRCGEHGGPALEIERCERVFDQPVDGIWASDHYGPVADLGPPVVR